MAYIEGLIGYVRGAIIKAMTLESVVELENGKMVMVSDSSTKTILTSTIH